MALWCRYHKCALFCNCPLPLKKPEPFCWICQLGSAQKSGHRSRADSLPGPCTWGGCEATFSVRLSSMQMWGRVIKSSPYRGGTQHSWGSEAHDTCRNSLLWFWAICATPVRSQVKAGTAGHRSEVCLCKPGCQHSTSPTVDVAAGCRFPRKSPGQDSGEALNSRHLPHPAGCNLWRVIDGWLPGRLLLPNRAQAIVGIHFFQMKDCHPRREILLKWEKDFYYSPVGNYMIIVIIILRTWQNVDCPHNVSTLRLNLVAIKIWISSDPRALLSASIYTIKFNNDS